MRRTTFLIFSLGIIFLLSGCRSYGTYLNFDETAIPTGKQEIKNFSPLKIQANDIISIRISSVDAAALAPFMMGASQDDVAKGFQEYLVNRDGFIEFPTIGKVDVKGLEIEEAKAALLEKLNPYFKNPPIVEARLSNFKVNINGEVNNPGTFKVTNDRLTIIEAITLAGDFTKYSRRDSIMIVREVDGSREFGYVNFNTAEVFDSDYYYLQQNDIVYVRPHKSIKNSTPDATTKIATWVSTGISILIFIFTVARN